MNKPLYYAAAGLAALVLGLIILKPGGTITNNTTNNTATNSAQTTTPSVSTEDRFYIEVRDGKNQAGAQSYKTVEGKTVKFQIASNLGGDFHVHGYDLDKELVPGQTVELTFTADKTGRFDLEYHPAEGEHTVLGALEVTPR